MLRLQQKVREQSARLANAEDEEDVLVLRRYIAELKEILSNSESQNGEVGVRACVLCCVCCVVCVVLSV